jgi:hypothetical protein
MSLESPAIIATFVQLRLYWWMKESVYRRQDALDIYWLLLAYGYLCPLLEWIWKSCGQIDEDVIQEVVRLGFDRTQLIDSLVNRLQNKVMNSCSAYLVFQQCLCSYFYWHCAIWAWQTCVSAMVPWQYVLWHHFTSGVIKGYVQGALGPNHCPLVDKLCCWLRCLLVEGPAKMKQSFPLHACRRTSKNEAKLSLACLLQFEWGYCWLFLLAICLLSASQHHDQFFWKCNSNSKCRCLDYGLPEMLGRL